MQAKKEMEEDKKNLRAMSAELERDKKNVRKREKLLGLSVSNLQKNLEAEKTAQRDNEVEMEKMKKRLEAIEKREQQVKRSNENLQRQRGRIEDVKIQLDVRKRKLDEQKRAQAEEATRLEQLHKQIGRKRALAKHEKKEAVELRKSLILTLAQAKSDVAIADIETKLKPKRSQ